MRALAAAAAGVSFPPQPLYSQLPAAAPLAESCSRPGVIHGGSAAPSPAGKIIRGAVVTPPPPPNPGALEGGIWEFSEGQTGRDWELEQLRYLPGQSKQFGNILGGDNQTLAEPSAGGSSQSREEATHQMSWSLGFYEPGGLAGSEFASSEDPTGSWDPLKLSPDTVVDPCTTKTPIPTPGSPSAPCGSRRCHPPCSCQPGRGHPSSVPSVGGGTP